MPQGPSTLIREAILRGDLPRPAAADPFECECVGPAENSLVSDEDQAGHYDTNDKLAPCPRWGMARPFRHPEQPDHSTNLTLPI